MASLLVGLAMLFFGSAGPVGAETSSELDVPVIEGPENKQELIGLRIVEARRQPMHRKVRTVGRVEYDERNVTTVNTKFEGWIEKLHADYTGQFIRKGAPLAEIYSPELLATQQEYLSLLRWARGEEGSRDQNLSRMLRRDAEAIITAARQRLELWDISQEEIRRIEETGKPIRTLRIYSPVSGYVVQKKALQGMRVMPGENLFDLADLSTVWVVADIYEYELPLVKPGDAALIALSYIPEKTFVSKVDYVYPALAPDTRTAKVRLSVPNAEGLLKPQMFSNVELTIALGNRLTVPEDAVIDTGARKIVYVDRGEGYFEPREVALGLRSEGTVEITRGLQPGERVATAANFLLDSEASLKGVTPLPLQ